MRGHCAVDRQAHHIVHMTKMSAISRCLDAHRAAQLLCESGNLHNFHLTSDYDRVSAAADAGRSRMPDAAQYATLSLSIELMPPERLGAYCHFK